MDRQRQIQALDRAAPIRPCCPGSPSGAATLPRHSNLFAAWDVASGMVIYQLTARHRAIEAHPR